MEMTGDDQTGKKLVTLSNSREVNFDIPYQKN